jgi:hypothetical protein
VELCFIGSLRMSGRGQLPDSHSTIRLFCRVNFTRRRNRCLVGLRADQSLRKREVGSAQSIRSSSYCREESFRLVDHWTCCEDRENSIRYKLIFVKKFPS